MCPHPDGRPGAPPRSAPPSPEPAAGGLSSCLPAGGAERRTPPLRRDLEALACRGPRLLAARERRLFPGPRLLRGRPRSFLRSPPRPPSPRRRAAAGRAGHLPCGAGCRPAQTAWLLGRPCPAPPAARPACAAPVPAYSRKEAGRGGRAREMAAPAPAVAPPTCGWRAAWPKHGSGAGLPGEGRGGEESRRLPRSSWGEPLAGDRGAFARVPSANLDEQGVKNK